MSTYLRKCIDIAPTAIVSAHEYPVQDYRRLREESWWRALRATTSWLRLWADWPSLQRGGDEPGSDALSAAAVAALDGQIEAAHADGMQIIVMPYRYPQWANETDHLVGGSDADFEFYSWDRVARLSAYLTWRAGGVRPDYKSLHYRVPPEGHGPKSQWARFVEWLWDRYAHRIAAFEVVNEPNGQLWPQRTQVDTTVFDARWGTTGTTLASAPATAEMITTVDAIARRYPNGPVLLAPSTSDTLQSTILRYTTISHTTTHAPFFDPFVETLLPALDARGFVAHDRWIWSFHNYTDSERRFHFSAELREILRRGGWRGRQLDGGPEMWATEGGCRVSVMQTRFGAPFNRTLPQSERLDYQARVLTEALSRHHYAKGAGAGIGMYTQYTTYVDPRFDDGLLESDGTPRPSLAAWSAMPEFHAAPAQRTAWRPQF
jgi:hypothetical protein